MNLAHPRTYAAGSDPGLVQKVLVLAPHPDDETLGCGGSIKWLTAAGGQVDVAFLTRGEKGIRPGTIATSDEQAELAIRRSVEARRACQILGVRNAFFLEGQDGRLHVQPTLAADILRLLNEHAYQSVFCPHESEGHPDHRATFQLLRTALSAHAGELTIWRYEVWTPLLPTMLIPIDGTIDAKREAISVHASQMACYDYLSAFVGLAQYRAIGCAPAHYAEAFAIVDKHTLLAGLS